MVGAEHAQAIGQQLLEGGRGAVHGFTHRDAVGPGGSSGVAFDERADRLTVERVNWFFAETLGAKLSAA